MIFEHTVDIPAAIEVVWPFVNDLAAISTCVPGVEGFEQRTPEEASGTLKLSVGPITTRLAGTVNVVERDDEAHRSVVQVAAADPRIGSKVGATAEMTLQAVSPTQTTLAVHADVNILGRLGSFGQPVIRRKAEQVIKEFAANLTNALETGGSAT